MSSKYCTKCFLYLCFVSSILTDIDGYTIGTDESFINLVRSNRAAKSCDGSNQFKCGSGECIPKVYTCNGIDDCEDKTDESKKTCSKIICPGFICDNGVCLEGNIRCNGVNDCLDSSDEQNCGNELSMTSSAVSTSLSVTKPSTVTKSPQVTNVSLESGCTLPDHPKNGRWDILGDVNAQQKTKVGLRTVIKFTCDTGYKITGSTHNVCIEGGWTSPSPLCQKLCPPLHITSNSLVICRNEEWGVQVKCEEAVDGTSARFECAPYYEPSHRTRIAFCIDGSWNLPPPKCTPVCGRKRITEGAIITDYNVENYTEYPWVAAIFKKEGDQFINICGGSILTQKIIITAAHCVTSENGSPVSVDSLRIGVGKYYRNFNDPRDTKAQYSAIQKVLVHTKYRGEAQRYSFDIAFLVTKDTLILSSVVLPVCFHDLYSVHLTRGQVGMINGWGFTKADRKSSDELISISMAYKNDSNCYVELPTVFRDKYFTHDKLCAGYYRQGAAVCSGGGGAGLVFQNPEDQRYYIYGLASVGHVTNLSCDTQLSPLFTKVAYFSDWLEELAARYSNID